MISRFRHPCAGVPATRQVRAIGLLCLLGVLITTPVTVRADGPQDAIETVQRSVVKLYGAGGLKNLAGYGTGFLVSPDGHIATVWSHLLDSELVTVVLHDGRRYFGKVVSTDSRKDLALLKIDATGLPCFDLEATAAVGPGARVLAFGNMFKVASGDEPVSVMRGVVSAKTDLQARRGRHVVPYSGPVYVVDAVTNNPGAAGGVLTTYDGRLLAMLGRELKHAGSNTWLNYAMPIGELKTTIEDMIAGRFQRSDPLIPTELTAGGILPADLGIVLVPDVVQRTPAYLETVVPESQAEQLGLAADDLIVFANGELVHSIRAFSRVLQQLTPGDDLQLVVRRDSQLISVTFRVPNRK